MSQGKITGALVGLFVVATSAGTVAAWNYSSQSIPAFAQRADTDLDAQPQLSNADAKTDRLPIMPIVPIMELAAIERPVAEAPMPASYAVASLAPVAVEPPKARVEPWIEPRAETRKPVAAEKPAPADKPAAAEKTKRAEPKTLLDDAQIASLRTRLKLTPTQEEFWPAVEITLRDVVREHLRKNRKTATQGIASQIDVNSPEVQRLVSAAVPLIMRMSEDQKREVRQLARIIGLNEVAARI